MNLFKSHISHVFKKKKVTLTLIISNRKNNMYIFEINERFLNSLAYLLKIFFYCKKKQTKQKGLLNVV